MADIQGALQKKVGPLPVWGWAAAAGGLVSVVILSRRGAAASAQSQDQANVPYVPSPIIVTPQTMPPSTSSMNPTSAPGTGVPDTPFDPGQWQQQGSGYLFTGQEPYVKGGMAYRHITAGTSSAALMQSGAAVYYFPVPGVPVPFGSGGALTGPVPQYLQTAATGSGGGWGASMMSYVPGSGGGKLLRHVSPHAHQQYVATGMGGGVQTGPWAQDPRRGLALNQGQNIVGGMGGGGHARLQAVSAKTGLPMTRLMSLNPHQWQRHRHPRGHIHIA